VKNKRNSYWKLVHNAGLWRFFCLSRHNTSTAASVVNVVRQSQVCHTERPPMITTRWPWRKAPRRSSATAELVVTICCVYQFYFSDLLRSADLPSVLWHCWLDGRKGIPGDSGL